MLATEPSSNNSSSLNLVRLSTPGAADLAQLINFHTSLQMPVHYKSLRMRSLTCNSPNITGYSALSGRYGTVTIQSHAQDTGLISYEELDAKYSSQSDVWIYMPIDAGEHVDTISVMLRVQRGSYIKEIALIVSSPNNNNILQPTNSLTSL